MPDEPIELMHVEWATFHYGHLGGGPNPLINETGRNERLADVRVERWKTIPHERTVKMHRTVRTIYGPWEPVTDA